MFISASRFRSHAAHGQTLVKLIKIDHCYPSPKRGWWAGRTAVVAETEEPGAASTLKTKVLSTTYRYAIRTSQRTQLASIRKISR